LKRSSSYFIEYYRISIEKLSIVKIKAINMPNRKAKSTKTDKEFIELFVEV